MAHFLTAIHNEWCQPADTKVRTPDGIVPIASLRDGDRVVSFSRKHSVMVGLREGLPVRCTSRPYTGQLVGIAADLKTTWCTPGHLWSVRLSPCADQYWCVYLMKKGRWWRVGKSKILSTWGLGIKDRIKTEGGEHVWILSAHASNVDATISEQLILAEYGIPTTTWAECHAGRRTLKDVARLYARLDLDRLEQNAMRALADHGRHIDYPFVSFPATREKVSRRVTCTLRACNILPEIISVPLSSEIQPVQWVPVRATERQPFSGDVYSMDVERYAHYDADGLVTHNCFYGWKEGAGHQFFGPNNARDTWEIRKVSPQSMIHLTEKPVELAVRALQYSSRVGENVLDLFGGSGSTLIGCQQTGRKAFLMELDPLYADVIVDRWQRFSGKQALLAATGEPFPKAPPATREQMR